MPAILVSAVNTGTDTLTATAHGLLTGDRCRFRNVGGALPGGLSAGTDVFAIVTDVNNVKLATSNAAAIAGTPVIDITSAGSGTTTLEYGLPYCLPTAAAAQGAQVKSINDNNAWAALVALYSLLVGVTQALWSTIVIAVTVSFTAVVTFAAGAVAAANQHFTVSGTGLYKRGSRVRHYSAQSFVGGTFSGPDIAMSNTDTYRATIQLEQGETLTGVTVYTTGASAMSSYTTNVKKQVLSPGSSTPAATTLGTASGPATASGVGGQSPVTGLTETAPNTPVRYYIEVVVGTSAAGGGTLNGFDVTTTI